jgi:hypothetical protein
MSASYFYAFACSCLLLLNINPIIGQSTLVEISKSACSDSKDGFFLNVEVRKDNRNLDTAKSYYDYHEIHRLNDATKIEIIGRLFQFAFDTSLCCRKVSLYDNSEYGGCVDFEPESKKFSIRIEALFIINRICYGAAINRLSCYPVLYDSETKKEINTNNCLVSIMVERYKAWYKLYKDTGTLPDYHFLNDGRIKWWGKHLQ